MDIIRRACLLTVTLLCLQHCCIAQAQQKRSRVKVPQPETVLIETKDAVELRAEWFGGTKAKETVPMIMIHDWDSDRSALTKLARRFQKEHGLAVIVPDLRGHGQSLTVKGLDDELDRKRFKKNELASIFEDIDACRRFLQAKNDQGELNLDLLTVLACGKTSIQAANWCVTDWSWAPLNGVKQGQNVKSLFLISPVRRFKSLSLSQALKTPIFASKSNALPILLFWGEDNKTSEKEGQAIYNALKKSRRQPDKFSWDSHSVFHVYYESDLASEDLLDDRSEDIGAKIIQVIENKIIANLDEFPWQQRKVRKN